MTVSAVLESTLSSFAFPTKYSTKRQPWRFWRFRRLWRFWSWRLPPLNLNPLRTSWDCVWPFSLWLGGIYHIAEFINDSGVVILRIFWAFIRAWCLCFWGSLPVLSCPFSRHCCMQADLCRDSQLRIWSRWFLSVSWSIDLNQGRIFLLLLFRGKGPQKLLHKNPSKSIPWGRKDQQNINNFSGLSREWVGANLFMVCCLFLGEEEKHIDKRPGKSQENAGTVLG